MCFRSEPNFLVSNNVHILIYGASLKILVTVGRESHQGYYLLNTLPVFSRSESISVNTVAFSLPSFDTWRPLCFPALAPGGKLVGTAPEGAQREAGRCSVEISGGRRMS